MADTGAPYFIPFAEPTDLVRDWPELSEDVALAIVAALENIPVVEKRIEAFTGSGTWTVPAGVTYAIAHMIGGGGGVGTATTGGDGGTSSVAFASGTVSANGGRKGMAGAFGFVQPSQAGLANTGQPATFLYDENRGGSGGGPSSWVVAGAEVTPAASISVTVGAGGTAGSSAGPGSAAAGGSGYVYIEYYEEV
jgi:hypothetical protein